MRFAVRFLVRGPKTESSASLVSGCEELICDAWELIRMGEDGLEALR